MVSKVTGRGSLGSSARDAYDAKDALLLDAHDRRHAAAADWLSFAQVPVHGVGAPHVVIRRGGVRADASEDDAAGEHVAQLMDGRIEGADEALVLLLGEAGLLRGDGGVQPIVSTRKRNACGRSKRTCHCWTARPLPRRGSLPSSLGMVALARGFVNRISVSCAKRSRT